MIIWILSYLLGIFFYQFCELSNNFEEEIDRTVGTGEHFVEAFGLFDKSALNRSFLMMYYAFTSLSTVGFGDYYPKSNKERLFIALVLLIGVAVFSLVLGNFNEIMDEIRLLGQETNEEEELNRFFSLIRKMNSDNEFDPKKRS